MEVDKYGIGNYYEGNYERSEETFGKSIAEMKLGLKKVPKINAMERKILEFCHNRDIKEFLREEFEKHPIKLDDNGNLIGENPFDKERRERGENTHYQGRDTLYESIGAINAMGGEF